MKKKTFFILIMIIFCVVVQTGCTSSLALEELLSPPRLTDEQSEIYQALIQSKGTGFRLKYPKSGDFRSAFVVYNIDDEKTDEAIVFYEASGINAERGLWLNFLDQNEKGEWESIYDLSVKGADIDRVTFTMLGNDPKINIIVSYTMSQTEKGFAVIQYTDKMPKCILEDTFTYLGVDDYFDNGQELFVIKTDHNVETSTATFYNITDGQFSIGKSCELNPDAREYISVTRGFLNKKTEAIILNFRKYKNDEQYGTDVLIMQSGELINPILQKDGNTDYVTRRTNSRTDLANPRDIDGDGFIELCSTTPFPGYSSLSQTDRVNAVIWRNLNGNTLEKKYYSYYSEKNDYIFILPNRWQSVVTAVVSLDGNRVDFLIAEKSVVDADVQLLSIRTTHDRDTKPSGEGWRLYATNHKKQLWYYILCENPGETLSLTKDEMENGFKILDNE